MAIGFGPGSEMQKSVNKQRSSRKKRSLKESSDGTAFGKNAEVGLKFKEATPEQLAEIREKMQKEKKRNLVITLVLLGMLLAVVIYVAMQPIL